MLLTCYCCLCCPVVSTCSIRKRQDAKNYDTTVAIMQKLNLCKEKWQKDAFSKTQITVGRKSPEMLTNTHSVRKWFTRKGASSNTSLFIFSHKTINKTIIFSSTYITCYLKAAALLLTVLKRQVSQQSTRL